MNLANPQIMLMIFAIVSYGTLALVLATWAAIEMTWRIREHTYSWHGRHRR